MKASSMAPAALLVAALVAGCATTPSAGSRAAVAGTDMTHGPPCPRTGSRIERSPGHCTDAVRSYTGDEISTTGATSTGQALKVIGTTGE